MYVIVSSIIASAGGAYSIKDIEKSRKFCQFMKMAKTNYIESIKEQVDETLCHIPIEFANNNQSLNIQNSNVNFISQPQSEIETQDQINTLLTKKIETQTIKLRFGDNQIIQYEEAEQISINSIALSRVLKMFKEEQNNLNSLKQKFDTFIKDNNFDLNKNNPRELELKNLKQIIENSLAAIKILITHVNNMTKYMTFTNLISHLNEGPIADTNWGDSLVEYTSVGNTTINKIRGYCTKLENDLKAISEYLNSLILKDQKMVSNSYNILVELLTADSKYEEENYFQPDLPQLCEQVQSENLNTLQQKNHNNLELYNTQFIKLLINYYLYLLKIALITVDTKKHKLEFGYYKSLCLKNYLSISINAIKPSNLNEFSRAKLSILLGDTIHSMSNALLDNFKEQVKKYYECPQILDRSHTLEQTLVRNLMTHKNVEELLLATFYPSEFITSSHRGAIVNALTVSITNLFKDYLPKLLKVKFNEIYNLKHNNQIVFANKVSNEFNIYFLSWLKRLNDENMATFRHNVLTDTFLIKLFSKLNNCLVIDNNLNTKVYFNNNNIYSNMDIKQNTYLFNIGLN